MKNILAAIVAVIAIGALGFLAFGNNSSNNTETSQSNSNTSVESGDTHSDMLDMTAGEQGEVNQELDPNNYTDGANIGSSIDATDQTEVQIVVDDFIFETTYLKIKPGTTVTWINNGRTRHDVMSASSSPNKGLESNLLSNGEQYSFTFTEAGLYEYFCSPHPTQMRATILVEES